MMFLVRGVRNAHLQSYAPYTSTRVTYHARTNIHIPGETYITFVLSENLTIEI